MYKNIYLIIIFTIFIIYINIMNLLINLYLTIID